MLPIFKNMLTVVDTDGHIPVNTTPMPAVLTAVLRPVIAFALGSLAQHGLIDNSEVAELVSYGLAGATLLWSAYAAHKAHAKQAALATGTPAKPV